MSMKEELLTQAVIDAMNIPEHILEQSCIAHFYDAQDGNLFDVVLPVELDSAQEYINTHYLNADEPIGAFESIPRSFDIELTGVEDFKNTIKTLVEYVLEAEAIHEHKTKSDMSID